MFNKTQVFSCLIKKSIIGLRYGGLREMIDNVIELELFDIEQEDSEDVEWDSLFAEDIVLLWCMKIL